MTNQAKVGIFATVAIAILVIGFYFLKGTNLFERKNKFYAVYDRVDGLHKSNIVDINGLQVGRVGDMERDPISGKIVVEIVLEKSIMLPKSDSTVAYLLGTDFLGSKIVRLNLGQSNQYYNEGDTLNTYFKKDLTEQLGAQIDPIMYMVRNMLPKLDSTIGGLNMLFDAKDPKSIFTTLDHVNGILVVNQKTLQVTLQNLQSITGNVEKSNATITKILDNAGNFTDSLQKANIKQTVENLNTTISELKTVLNDINAGKGTLGKVMKSDALYNKVDTAVGNLNVLLKDVKERPYRYISINVLGAKKAEERRAVKYNESAK